MTYQDYLALPEDGRRYEILDGEPQMTPSPSTKHQTVSRNLVVMIGSFLGRQPVGEVFAAPLDVVLSEVNVVQPDVVFVSNDRRATITERNISGPPDLTVEILSEGNRRLDEVLKRRLYARAGVREYWLVDPELETVRVLRLEGDVYREASVLWREAGAVLTTDLLPGLELPLANVFR